VNHRPAERYASGPFVPRDIVRDRVRIAGTSASGRKTLDLFFYILILTSVLFALAVAQILEGVSRLVQTSQPVRTYLPHTVWVLNLFVYIFLIWWATWEFRTVEWSFLSYVYMLIAPTLLFLACSSLMPREPGDEGFDLERHFNRVRRLFFSAYALATLAVVADGNVLADEALWHGGRIGHIAILTAAVVGYSNSSKKVDLAIALVTSVAFAALSVTRFLLPR